MASFWQRSIPQRSRARGLLQSFRADEGAATAIEYALIAVVLAGCLFLALPLVSTELADTFTQVGGYLAAILAG
jgi:Flp pilus assembly pilin Flp